MPLYFTKVLSLLFGLIWGSFLNVCIQRIPLGKSLVGPGSSCPKCGAKIRPYDNIPLLSYLLLLGRCRSCKAPISPRYPVVELLTALLSLALFLRFGLGARYIVSFLFCSALVVISFIDLDHKIIPDSISLPGILVGVVVSVLGIYSISWLDSLLGALCGGGFLYLIATVFERFTGKQGMGGGDIKLMAMIGAWMGWKSLPFVILISSITGIFMGGAGLLLAGMGYRAKIPFGPFLSLGALVYFFFGVEIVGWYIGILS
ncbi:MAG: prepilin peptidase [Deltaproteobacteria bacterium]|nr:prepilin peptidase [Deltaproteobacteria bacterium]